MGMAKLNVWISGMDDPCSISDRTWYVTIYDCDGNVLEWCGKKFALLPAKCGHLEVAVPPGCYYIKAVWGFWPVQPGKYWANHFTDAAIVQTRCDETTCVKLFNPSAHRCGWIYVLALRDLARQKVVRGELVKQAEELVKAILNQIPRPYKEFELGHEEEIDKFMKGLKPQGKDDQQDE